MGKVQEPYISERAAALVSPCILAPGLQAAYKRGTTPHWGWEFIELLHKYDIDIIPLPCAESAFKGYQKGLRRGKHGIDYYMALDGYCSHCRALASQAAAQILDMAAGGYHFLALLGVEHSPNCAINYMYTHKGMLKRSGLFVEVLDEILVEHMFKTAHIGINRTKPGKALRQLEQLLFSYKA